MSTEQMRWKFGNEFLPFHHQASHVNPDYRDGWNAAYKAAISQPAAPAPKDAAPDIAAIRHTLMTGLSHNPAIAALDRIAAMEQERDDINRRCSEYMEAGNQQALRMAALEAQLAAQPKREPLTDFHIGRLKTAALNAWYGQSEPYLIFARSIEAAHGINAAAQGEAKS